MNCIGALSLWSVHTFSWFLKSNWSSDFGHVETRNGAKEEVVLRREIFLLSFWSRVRKRCLNNNSLSCWWFFVHMRQFDFHFQLLLNQVHSNYCKRVFFNAKFSFDSFDFSCNFYALDFLRFAWSKILPQSQFQAAELNCRKLNTKNQKKRSPKLVPFFTLNLNSGICQPLMWFFEAHYWTS